MSGLLIRNRRARCGLDPADWAVLETVIAELRVPDAWPGGPALADDASHQERNDRIGHRIETGAGLGPELQESNVQTGGGGFLPGAALGRAVWPRSTPATQEAQGGSYLLRARGLPNRTGKALFPAPLWEVGVGGSTSRRDGTIKRRAGVYRVPLLELGSWLVDVPRSAAKDLPDSPFPWDPDDGWSAALAAAGETGAIGALPERHETLTAWRVDDPDACRRAVDDAVAAARPYLRRARAVQEAVQAAADRRKESGPAAGALIGEDLAAEIAAAPERPSPCAANRFCEAGPEGCGGPCDVP